MFHGYIVKIKREKDNCVATLSCLEVGWDKKLIIIIMINNEQQNRHRQQLHRDTGRLFNLRANSIMRSATFVRDPGKVLFKRPPACEENLAKASLLFTSGRKKKAEELFAHTLTPGEVNNEARPTLQPLQPLFHSKCVQNVFERSY